MIDTTQYEDPSFKVAAERELQLFSSGVENSCSSLQSRLLKLHNWTGSGDVLFNVHEPWKVQPIKIKLSPFEPPGLRDAGSDIAIVNKTVMALAALCHEARLLISEAETELVPPIALYGETASAGTERPEVTGESHVYIARCLPLLGRVQCYADRVSAVVTNFLLQMHALYPAQVQQNPVLCTKDVHLQVVWEHLGRLLATVSTLDHVLAANAVLNDHWKHYRRLVTNAPAVLLSETNAAEEELDHKLLQPLHRMTVDLQENVMHARTMFKQVCERSSRATAGTVTNSALREEMLAVVLGWCSQLESQSGAGWWCDLQQEVVAVTCLMLLHQLHFDPQPSKRAARALQQLFRKVPCVTLYGSVVWRGEQFVTALCARLKTVWEPKVCASLVQHRNQHLSASTAGLAKLAASTKLQVDGWCAELAAAAAKPSSHFTRQDLSQRCKLFMQGLVLAVSARYSVTSVLSLHLQQGRALTRSCVLSVCALLHAVHAVRAAYETHMTQLLAHTVPHVAQFLVAQLLAVVALSKSKLSTGSSNKRSHTDALASLRVVESCLGCSAPTTSNLTTARLALSLASQPDVLKGDDFAQLVLLLRRLELLSELQERVLAATDVGVLLYTHSIIVTSFCEAYGAAMPAHPASLQAVLSCATQARPHLLRCCHLPQPQLLLDAFSDRLCSMLQEKIVGPVCTAVETELRLSTLSHLQVQPRNPYSSSPAPPTPGGTTGSVAAPPIYNPDPYLSLPPLQCLGRVLNLKERVEQYLSSTLYALTVVAPHDCHTNNEMRALALHKWGLMVHDARLPPHTTHQGVDVLEVVRQLSVFVRSYHYSMSQQVFTEARSDSKHLNTLSITHIANSVRTHGAGIINSTVNFTYQFLVGKFKIFSQFLYDEQIKSRLIKDKRHWVQVRTATEKWFPFERAEKFNLSIRKLGLNAQGLSYLDQFRELVTQIGNAMGFVRLVRSGSLRCSSNTVRFLPVLEELKPFEQLCRSGDEAEHSNVSPETMTAARNLDTVVLNLQHTFQKETDFFKILVDVFKKALTGESYRHLSNFHLIIAALAINFVHHSVIAKDLLNKKSKTGAAISMDGFAMGIAYLLSVLDQGSAFDSMHWWSGVRRHFIAQRETVERQRNSALSSGDSKLAETLALTLSRLREHQQEHELLYLTVSSARGFFRTTERDDGSAGDRESSKAGDKDSVRSGESELS